MGQLAIVKGSIADVARQTNTSVADTLFNARTIVIADRSGSMGEYSGAEVGLLPQGELGNSARSKYEVAREELKRIQTAHPGKVGLVAFDDVPELCLDGHLPLPRGNTYVANALNFILPFDGTGIQFVLISDGFPNDPDEAMRVARSMKTPIDCIFIDGYDGLRGRRWLEELAKATRGTYRNVNQVLQLGTAMDQILRLTAG